MFWRQLLRCFDEIESSTAKKVTHYARVAFEKPAGKNELTINKRTSLAGKAGPGGARQV